MNILLTGATGLIGKKIGLELVKKGHTLFAITRNIEKAKLTSPFPAQWIQCDLQKDTLAPGTLSSIDGVIHLAGENVGESQWSKEQKKNILESRTMGTKNLISSLPISRLQFFISASAIGFYGASETPATEGTALGHGFLAEVTAAWENETLKIETPCRVCIFRIGVVLSTDGGALPKMLFPAQIFASSKLGSGQQWLSWIHIDDVVASFAQAVESKTYNGIYNLVAPNPCRQKDIAQNIASQIGAFRGPPIPALFLKLILGEQASLALNSLNVSSQKLLEAGFVFQYPTLTSALKNILQNWKNGIAVKTYQQYFDLPKEKIFPFFAEAQNLETITPKSLHFKITKMSTATIIKNTLIDYSLKIHGFPVYWRTQIETWNPPHSFTDTQTKGPYKLWHHTHSFEDLGHGTLMTDTIKYKLPLGLAGRFAAQAFVDNDIENIFNYRRDVVGRLF